VAKHQSQSQVIADTIRTGKTCRIRLPKHLPRWSIVMMTNNHPVKRYRTGRQQILTQSFFYRKRDELEDTSRTKESEQPAMQEQSFLSLHQEPWQQRLLKQYGGELCLMDATYKTMRYAIPLFFICIHTNVGYKVVVEFQCQSRAASIYCGISFRDKEVEPEQFYGGLFNGRDWCTWRSISWQKSVHMLFTPISKHCKDGLRQVKTVSILQNKTSSCNTCK